MPLMSSRSMAPVASSWRSSVCCAWSKRSVELRKTAFTLAWCSAPTWSWINAISGNTTMATSQPVSEKYCIAGKNIYS